MESGIIYSISCPVYLPSFDLEQFLSLTLKILLQSWLKIFFLSKAGEFIEIEK
jgi:hypothetical protein